MTRKEIIDGLKFTVEMFLFDPSTGETFTEPRNDMDKTTIDACKGAIELLEQTDGDLISREVVIEWLKGKDIIKLSSQEEAARKELKALSSVELQPYIENMPSADNTAKWRIVGKTTLHYECSKCGGAGDKWDKFCKHCGAKMKKESEEEE